MRRAQCCRKSGCDAAQPGEDGVGGKGTSGRNIGWTTGSAAGNRAASDSAETRCAASGVGAGAGEGCGTVQASLPQAQQRHGPACAEVCGVNAAAACITSRRKPRKMFNAAAIIRTLLVHRFRATGDLAGFARSWQSHQRIRRLITSTTAGSSGKITGKSLVRTVRSPTRRHITFTGHPQAL